MARWRWVRETVLAASVVVACGGQSVRRNESDGDGSSGASGSGGTDGSPGESGTAGSSPGGRNGTCSWKGATFDVGAGRTEDDGCTICTCTPSGMQCNSEACESANCRAIADDYALVVAAARHCDPANILECDTAVTSNIPCGCQVPVVANGEITALAHAWVEGRCQGATFECPPCPWLEPPYGCAVDGICVMR